jgi:hydrogenase small subunit
MPGFPDKFMPFLEEPPGAQLSTTAVVMYGKTVRALRSFTRASLNREPEWRQTKNGSTSHPLETETQLSGR